MLADEFLLDPSALGERRGVRVLVSARFLRGEMLHELELDADVVREVVIPRPIVEPDRRDDVPDPDGRGPPQRSFLLIEMYRGVWRDVPAGTDEKPRVFDCPVLYDPGFRALEESAVERDARRREGREHARLGDLAKERRGPQRKPPWAAVSRP